MVATIITYNAGVMLSRMIFLPRHDQTDTRRINAKNRPRGCAAFRVTNFSDEDLAIPSHHALPARYTTSLISTLIETGNGAVCHAIKSSRSYRAYWERGRRKN